MPYHHAIWRFKDVPRACQLEGLANYPDYDELMYGKPQSKKFPKTASFQMDRDSPRATRLVDCLININGLIVASPRLQRLLQDEVLQDVEYLAVTIYDHKKKIAAGDYVIVHPVGPVNCVDLKRSKITWGTVDDEYIESIEDLVVDEARIEPTRRLFRLQHRPDMILAHRTLANKILQAELEGVEFMEIPDYFD